MKQAEKTWFQKSSPHHNAGVSLKSGQKLMPIRGIRHPKCGLFDKPFLTELMISSDLSMQTIHSTSCQ